MLQTIEGRYHDGKIDFLENPPDMREARVIMTFLPIEDDDEKERQRLEAAEGFIAWMKKGLNFGPGKFDREEIYEERLQELEERRNRH